MKEIIMDKNEFKIKKPGLIIVRLNPEEYFKKKIDNIIDYHKHIGLMHGELLQKEIQEMADFLPRFFIETRGKLMGKFVYKHILLPKAREMKKYIRPEYLAEMEGVARGARVDPDFILLINVFDELKNCQSNWWAVSGLKNLLLNLGDSSGCSALAVEEDKRLLYGVNTDYAVFGDKLGPNNTVSIYQMQKFGHSFVSISWPGYVGVIRGMNDQGTVLISLASYSKDQRIKGVPTSLLYREILESNEPSLAKRDKNQVPKRTIGNNILIGNQQKVEIMEVSAKKWGIRKPQRIKGKKYITVTNHFQTAMDKYQRGPKPVKGSTIPVNEEEKWFWDFFGLESNRGRKGSKGRNDLLKAYIERYVTNSKKFTPETIKKILAQVANPYCTLACTIFDPANLEIWIADNEGKMPATEGKLVKINVRNLFKL